MCTMMSLVVTLMLQSSIPLPLSVHGLQTVETNFSMAMAWQLLIAGPLVCVIVGRIRE